MRADGLLRGGRRWKLSSPSTLLLLLLLLARIKSRKFIELEQRNRIFCFAQYTRVNKELIRRFHGVFSETRQVSVHSVNRILQIIKNVT